ncbi:sorbitol dehydrogenase [Lingula anatina]|uniref:Sorbitol dehydrogenase n=1 Tax=Lingula anatina TaxID=7574 RepID=A0A1S3K9L7_LINAN|nr:sorbitol dehydrogenase [Lingula anatina]|eukprot:XP_013419139.1 sorbitol dehydrogenase [Lingula anatina]
MGDTNLSAVLYAEDDMRLEEFPVKDPGPGEVQISMHSTGICGSDVHYWKHGRIGDFVLTTPMVLGHESSGTVCKVGSGVTSLKVGDRVAIEPGVPCRVCNYCKTGRYNLCREMQFCATPPYHGTLTRLYTHPADFCFKLPDNVSYEEGALLEPLSVGVHACRRAGVSLGSKVFICGAGPIGLVNMLTAKAMGASKVCISDISEGRLGVAKTMGADSIVLVNTKDAKAVAKQVETALGEMPDITIECSGAESSIQTGIYATKAGGVLMLVGLGPAEIKLPVVNAACREVDIRGLFRYANCYPAALEMIASGAVDVKPLITHHFTLEESLEAFETSRTGAGGAIKVMIKCAKQ